MPISRLALLAVASTAVPPIVRRMQSRPRPEPKADAKLAADVLASLDRIGELGPALRVWDECQRLRAAVSPLAAA